MLPIDDGDGFGMTQSQVGQAFTPTASPMDCASALSSTFGNMLRLHVDDIPLAHELDQKTHTSLQHGTLHAAWWPEDRILPCCSSKPLWLRRRALGFGPCVVYRTHASC